MFDQASTSPKITLATCTAFTVIKEIFLITFVVMNVIARFSFKRDREFPRYTEKVRKSPVTIGGFGLTIRHDLIMHLVGLISLD